MEPEVLAVLRRAHVGLVVILFSIVTWPFAGTTVAGQEQQPIHHNHAGNQGMAMLMDGPLDAAAHAKMEAKALADKKESEFNHHLAGFFVALAGVFVLFEPHLAKRWALVKYVWPVCFLLAGIFVLVWSDTELWPFGHRQWLEALQNNREVLQHKTFAILLFGLGAVEWQRARGALLTAWSGWVFPLVAISGSIILIFHQHEGGMVGPHHMETMARVQSQHLSYTACGLGIGVTKGLSELARDRAGIFTKTWPLLLLILGTLLMFYRE
jgi:putative copper resistance protein D